MRLAILGWALSSFLLRTYDCSHFTDFTLVPYIANICFATGERPVLTKPFDKLACWAFLQQEGGEGILGSFRDRGCGGVREGAVAVVCVCSQLCLASMGPWKGHGVLLGIQQNRFVLSLGVVHKGIRGANLDVADPHSRVCA